MEYSSLALISGASRGIGAAVARTLAEKKMGVVLVARSEQALGDVAGYLQSEGLAAFPCVADLSISSELEKVQRFVKDLNSDLKIVVHNAAIARVGSIEEMSPADWRRVIDVNLTAPFVLTQKLLPLMKKDSQFVFINSVAGRESFAEWSAYCSSKHGLKAFADTLRKEVAGRGIRVTSLFSASVDTLMHDDLPYDWDRSKMLKPRDVAKAVAYLLEQPDDVVIREMDIENPHGVF